MRARCSASRKTSWLPMPTTLTGSVCVPTAARGTGVCGKPSCRNCYWVSVRVCKQAGYVTVCKKEGRGARTRDFTMPTVSQCGETLQEGSPSSGAERAVPWTAGLGRQDWARRIFVNGAGFVAHSCAIPHILFSPGYPNRPFSLSSLPSPRRRTTPNGPTSGCYCLNLPGPSRIQRINGLGRPDLHITFWSTNLHPDPRH